jgi:hypothetical protein
MQKMKGFYAARKNLRVEARGQRFQLGDFVIKVGSVVLSQMTSFKGVLVEVRPIECLLFMIFFPVCRAMPSVLVPSVTHHGSLHRNTTIL